ncbi:acyl-coenzyme A synthetase ACSM1, mitochondrial-like [Hylobates moloch]|uniref:acyl-coenzyme A synthetase ACSM1, mitochondrial-like n=1 Tax=Hylobates moloch TaxID=81572 RepID=UPI0013639D7C|nr:acyl-coenzyme A synthetase ACSM1, mitochondrial-like [Hylobates moloch]
MDEEGYIWFLGRSHDTINASGYGIGPTEVQRALVDHPVVAESAMVSSPDPNQGEVRTAQRSSCPYMGTRKANARETSRLYLGNLGMRKEEQKEVSNLSTSHSY